MLGRPSARNLWTCRCAADPALHSAQRAEPTVAEHTPVLIASGALPDSHRDVLVNLAPEEPAEPAQFGRICEIVGADETTRQRARARWGRYREAGLEPVSHDL